MLFIRVILILLVMCFHVTSAIATESTISYEVVTVEQAEVQPEDVAFATDIRLSMKAIAIQEELHTTDEPAVVFTIEEVGWQ